MERNSLVLFIILIFVCSAWLFVMFQSLVDTDTNLVISNETLKVENAKLVLQNDSYKDYLAFNTRTYVNERGNAGMYDGVREMLYVKTSYGGKETCLLFLHELGHAMQYGRGDKCYYEKDLNSCENGALEYASENAYRCEGLK